MTTLPADQKTGRVIWRYATLGGAPVVVTRHETPYDDEEDRYLWQCLGCGEGSNIRWSESECQARANRHAGNCHATSAEMQAPEPATDPVAGMRDEVAGMRMDLAVLTGAVREFTATLARVVEPLAEGARAIPDIAQAVADMPDHGEALGDIATAVESLVSAVDRPRRSWWGRRRSAQAGEVSV